MKKYRTMLASLAAVACLSVSSAAHALAITDFINPEPDITVAPTSPYGFMHDISDGIGGYIAGVDTIVSAFITINLIDNVNKGNESFTFSIGSNGSSQVVNNSNLSNGNTATPFNITLIAALPDLIADGKLSVLLSATSGDYIFTDSFLSAEVTRGVTQPPGQVPEPATALLLAIGLCGLGMRRKIKQSA